MLSDSIKTFRLAKGLSQEELAVKLNVVRQTVSKWEKGLSVPDADLLISLADALDVSVGTLLGEAADPTENTQVQILATKLEILNEQFAQQAARRRKAWRIAFILMGCLALLLLLLSLGDALYWHALQKNLNGDLSIIGGADGPTGILVSSVPFSGWAWIPALLIGAASLTGILCTQKRA